MWPAGNLGSSRLALGTDQWQAKVHDDRRTRQWDCSRRKKLVDLTRLNFCEAGKCNLHYWLDVGLGCQREQPLWGCGISGVVVKWGGTVRWVPAVEVPTATANCNYSTLPIGQEPV